MIAQMVLFLILTSIQNIEAQEDSISISITTSPPLLKKRFVCPGINFTFTCKTRGAETIAWSSEQYIGEGNSMITFAHGMDAVNSSSNEMRLSDHTVAKFTRDDLENGEPVLESTLQINTSTTVNISNVRNASRSVTCMDNHGRNRSIEFQVVADPGKPEELFAFQVPHPATDNCIATAVWRHSINISPDEIQHYQIFANGVTVSRDSTIINGTSNDGLVMASVFFLSGCMEHVIIICEVNICDHYGQESDPYPLEQCPCDTAITTTSLSDLCTCVTGGGSGRTEGNRNGKGSFVMLLTLFILFSGIHHILC